MVRRESLLSSAPVRVPPWLPDLRLGKPGRCFEPALGRMGLVIGLVAHSVASLSVLSLAVMTLWACFDSFAVFPCVVVGGLWTASGFIAFALVVSVWRLRLLVASVPGSPAGGRDRECLQLDLVICCSSACGAEFRVLASGGPLLVPCSLYCPATEILSFFLESFEVVDEGFLPPTAGRSLIRGTSACSGLLLRVTTTSLAFGLATAVFRYCCWFTRRYGWSPVLPAFGSGGRRRLVHL